MRPAPLAHNVPGLYILDLESQRDADVGRLTVENVERFTEQAATVLGIDDDLSGLLDADRVFVTGSVDMLDEVAWAEDVAVGIAAAAQAGVPVLAVCFGHQLMAQHFGGTIESFEEPKKGIQTISFDGSGPFPKGTARLIHTHRDHVVDGGELVPMGRGGFGGIPALRHPKWSLWSCQGHPEWDAELCLLDDATAWGRYRPQALDGIDGPAILARFAKLKPERAEG